MAEDSLQFLPENRWCELQEAFELDFPRCISGYNSLQTQKKLNKLGFEYGFKVFCPFGDVCDGMVALNKKDVLYQVIIQCPKDDTSQLELALRTTKIIDWAQDIEVPYAPKHIIECLKRVSEHLHVELQIYDGDGFWLKKEKASCKIISLLSGITFDHLSLEHVNLVDSTWPHRYPNSPWYFEFLINAKCGYGLFKEKQLVSWVFLNESGNLGHVYTLEDHRRQGYSELLLKIVTNVILQEYTNIIAYSVKGNDMAGNLYGKLGFKNFGHVAWCYIKKKK